jgi:hypothetical protein
MHLIIDIRSASPVDPIMTRYAGSWVDLWIARHPSDTVSYIHYAPQDCPDNGRSIVVSPPSWWWGNKKLSTPGTSEIFRCINFSAYPPYDLSIDTISHIWDHAATLYPHHDKSTQSSWFWSHVQKRNNPNETIIVPSLSIWQETVEIHHTREESIEIIPYITLTPGKWDRHTLAQLSISGSYWLYDGSYGSESGINHLLQWYKAYRDLGGIHTLLLVGKQSGSETRDIAIQIHSLGLTGAVRITWALEGASIESLYIHASGWLYIGAYYSGGPRIELARSHHIPLLISDIPSLSDYHSHAMTIHPSHLTSLGQMLIDLEWREQKETRNISNDNIMVGYERVISQKR